MRQCFERIAVNYWESWCQIDHSPQNWCGDDEVLNAFDEVRKWVWKEKKILKDISDHARVHEKNSNINDWRLSFDEIEVREL
jgi:hypothetical protein